MVDHRPTPEMLLSHAEFLRALARKLLDDPHATEDVVQESLLAAVRKPPGHDGLRAWLGTVVRNLAVSRRRSGARRARREQVAARPEAQGDVSEAVARLEVQQRVVQAVLALDPRDRVVVLEHYFHGRSVPEIGHRLGIPAATARTRLRRALERLRRKLDVRALALLALPLPAHKSLAAGVGLMSGKLKVAVVLVLVVAASWLLRAATTGDASQSRSSSAGAGASPAPSVAEQRATETCETDERRVYGRCVNALTGDPIPDVTVRVGESHATSDATGRFDLENTGGTLLARRPGFADAVVSLPLAQDTVALHPLLRCRGIVVTPAGDPAPNATVVLREGTVYDGTVRATTTAGAGGRFSIHVPDDVATPGPTRGNGAIHLAAHLPGWIEGAITVRDPDEELRIELAPARRIRGVVLEERNRLPIAGARLSLGGKWPVGRSDADGAFDVSVHPMPRPGAIPPGLHVRAKGYAPRQVLATDLRADGNRILLPASTTVRGVVVDPDGRPQPGIEVTSWRAHTPEPLTPEEQRRRERWGRKRPKLAFEPPHCSRVRADEQGAFTVEAAVDAPCRIAVDAWPYEAAAELLAPPSEPVTLTLRLQDQYHRMLAVRVRDEAGHPLPGVSVTWWTVPGAAGTGMGRSPTVPARTNGDGLASVWTNRNWTRPVLLYAWSPGWFGVSRAPVDRQRLTEPAEVVCAPTRTIRGRAVGTRLHPGARASLWLRVKDDAWWRVQFVRLAKDGRFLLPGAPAVAATLIVAGPDGFSLRRELEAGTGDLGDLALDAPVVTQGVVRTASGAPEPGAFVSWQPKRPFFRHVFIENPFLDRLKANANGEFAIPVWKQGIVHVSAQGGPFMEIPGHGAKIPMGNAVTLDHEPGSGPLEFTTSRR